jgi:hypothetical protein
MEHKAEGVQVKKKSVVGDFDEGVDGEWRVDAWDVGR